MLQLGFHKIIWSDSCWQASECDANTRRRQALIKIELDAATGAKWYPKILREPFHRTRSSILCLLWRRGLRWCFSPEVLRIQGAKHNDLIKASDILSGFKNHQECSDISSGFGNQQECRTNVVETYRPNTLFPAKRMAKPHTWQQDAHQLKQQGEGITNTIHQKYSTRGNERINFLVETLDHTCLVVIMAANVRAPNVRIV